LPQKCDACGKPDIHLSHRQTKGGDDYYGVRCTACGAELSFHQKKTGGMYVKQGEKMQKWAGGDNSQPNSHQSGGGVEF
jgi:ssDNA-binding Zn-finger/Zn-ribbon topoisomerase 1